MPSHIVTRYKELDVEWNQMVDKTRETRVQKLRDEITFLEGEIANPANMSESEYLQDCICDIKDIQKTLREIELLGY